MKVKIMKQKKNELKIEIEGESHTLCNVVQKTLLEDNRVDFAGYHIPHPLTASPQLYVRTKGKSKPDTVLKAAVKQIKKDTASFRKELAIASKKIS
ncbi:MAG: DNA-directed RNA polymerase subunit L [Candidatus Bathyarchaeota archaeon]|nr:MAG: DNA-directed RNA polymerase subunit L [Candidatus Bathyarchaeota archaeon]